MALGLKKFSISSDSMISKTGSLLVIIIVITEIWVTVADP